ncbi:hypothetical protein [Alcaligenes faecalis]|uniref:hypothetical protein n=1 Tax=Alcaligenes faecalis TaxID=511 RepID=UPI001C836053|nr:hypothetical protein [Alcaligenes faecalis]MBX6964370.1 hypothetical protein [Providencia rettgeri]MBX7032456.1 hypothetical protein [Alcaligenes faecalis]
MLVKTSLRAVVATVVMLSSMTAYAGPLLTVTFKNLSDKKAHHTIISVNDSNTYLYATPKPAAVVEPAASDTFQVQTGLINTNFASAHYIIGNKTCKFYTTYVDVPPSSGLRPYTVDATPSGSAICTANITSINAVTKAWSVEFTMR